MEKDLWFRVKIGYGEMDFISITQNELQKAIKAQVTGQVAIFSKGTIAGNNIMAIVPDYNKELGLNPEYKITGNDLSLISTKRKSEYEKCFKEIGEKTQKQLTSGSEPLKIK